MRTRIEASLRRRLPFLNAALSRVYVAIGDPGVIEVFGRLGGRESPVELR